MLDAAAKRRRESEGIIPSAGFGAVPQTFLTRSKIEQKSGSEAYLIAQKHRVVSVMEIAGSACDRKLS